MDGRKDYFQFDLRTIREIWKKEMKEMKNVINLYKKYGDKGYIGEEITQLQHATQAALLAEEYYFQLPENLRIELVLGAFLHDIGHLLIFEDDSLETMGNVGVKNHEELGALLLEEFGFPDLTCQLVRKHILTKRYLITVKEGYYDKLSEASKKTFEYQGGKLSKEEIQEFEKDKYYDYHLRMRQFDDQAKSTEDKILKKIELLNPIKYYKSLIEKYIMLYLI